jgi:hypothetical protein
MNRSPILMPNWRRRFRPVWPPDVFVLSTTLLQRSGAYTRVVMGDWPPSRTGPSWTREIRKLGRLWRAKSASGTAVPRQILKWWAVVAAAAGTPVRDIPKNARLVEALLQLCAVSDEASVGLGLPTRAADSVEDQAFELLAPDRPGGSTLCKAVDSSRCRVLPKMHTAQRGVTVRSLSHHLALCWTADIEPSWVLAPNAGFSNHLNLLLVPWPFEVTPRQFSPAVPRTGPLRNMGNGFGFFDFEPGPCSDLPELLTRLATKARQTVGPIDGIVLPECAINESDYEKCARAALAESKFLVCGVKGSGAGTFPSNRVRFAIRIGPDVSETDQELVIGELDPQSRSPILPDDGGTYTASDSDRNSGAPGTIAARSTPPRYTPRLSSVAARTSTKSGSRQEGIPAIDARSRLARGRAGWPAPRARRQPTPSIMKMRSDQVQTRSFRRGSMCRRVRQ